MDINDRKEKSELLNMIWQGVFLGLAVYSAASIVGLAILGFLARGVIQRFLSSL